MTTPYAQPVKLLYKRGDTFEQTFYVPSVYADGYFVGWTVTSQIRTERYSTYIADFTCTWVDPTTTRIMTISHIADGSDLWPIGDAVMDIQFVRTSDSFTQSTSTLGVLIVEDITQPIISS